MANTTLRASATRAATLLLATWLASAAWQHGASLDWSDARAAADTTPPVAGAAGFADLVDKVKPAVVGIRTEVSAKADDSATKQDHDSGEGLSTPQEHSPSERFSHPFTETPRSGTSLGSGFFISPDGYAVTTSHVVEDGQRIEVTTDDGKVYAAKVVGSDSQTDLALLKIDADREFPFVRFAKTVPRIGEWVLAVGNPFGLGGSVTAGIVSARARDIETGAVNDFIQIDAPINEGNSGGPSFDLHGDVIGVNSAIFTPSGGSVGIGFAIPAETANAVIPQLKDKGAVTRGWLGVQIQSVTPEIAEALGDKEAKGVLVVEPQADGPARKGGVATGDVIVSLNAQPVGNDHDLQSRVGALAPGTKVELGLRRNGETKTVTVTLGEMPHTSAKREKPSGG